MKAYSVKTILLLTVFLLTSCNNNCKLETEGGETNEAATLFGTEFLQGKVKAIVYNNKEGYDSLAFVYNKNGEVDKVEFHSNKVMEGHCRYFYSGSNRIEQHYFDKEGVEKSYEIVEFDDRKNITLYREYGHIFPDTTKMVLIYLKQNKYDKAGHKESAFEYHCDGIPPYKYRYTYNSDGTETVECFLAVTGDIYAITKRKRDKNGNVIEKNENLPWDTCDWTNIKIEYKYDDKNNWIERRTMDENPESYRNKYSKRRIHYLDE